MIIYLRHLIYIIRNIRFKILIPEFNKKLYTGHWIKLTNNEVGICKIIHSTEKESIEKLKTLNGDLFYSKPNFFRNAKWILIKREELL